MNRLRCGIALALTLGLCTPAGAAEMNMPPMKSSPAFDQLKTLVGSWEAQTPDGKPVKAAYQMVSAGSCLMESLDTPDGGNMITMYRMDADRLVMDHYCAMNNVPRMRASASADAKKVDFAFASATNLASPQDMHMHGLKVSFEDADHFSQEWTLRTKGKDQPVVFHFQRVK